MGIDGSFRKRQNPFAQVSNEALHNTELSCKARGLYAIIQSYMEYSQNYSFAYR